MTDTYTNNNPTSGDPHPLAIVRPGNLDDPTSSPHVVARIGSHTADFFAHLVLETSAQVIVGNIFRSRLDLDLTGPSFWRTITESLTNEDIFQPDVQRNSNIYSGIRLLIHDLSNATASDAAYSRQWLGRGLICAIWDAKTATRELGIFDQGEMVVLEKVRVIWQVLFLSQSQYAHGITQYL